MLSYFGYELSSSNYEGEYLWENWKRWDVDTPHVIRVNEADAKHASVPHFRRAVGHPGHIAFCALDRDDVDRFYTEVLVPLEKGGYASLKTRHAIFPNMVRDTMRPSFLTLMAFNLSLLSTQTI